MYILKWLLRLLWNSRGSTQKELELVPDPASEKTNNADTQRLYRKLACAPFYEDLFSAIRRGVISSFVGLWSSSQKNTIKGGEKANAKPVENVILSRTFVLNANQRLTEKKMEILWMWHIRIFIWTCTDCSLAGWCRHTCLYVQQFYRDHPLHCGKLYLRKKRPLYSVIVDKEVMWPAGLH